MTNPLAIPVKGTPIVVPRKSLPFQNIPFSSIRDRSDKKFAESFLTLVSKPDLTEVNFFAVLFPEAKPGTGDYGSRPVTTRLDAAGWVGAKIEHSNGSDLGFFRTGSENGLAGGFTTDAKRFTASFGRAGILHKAYFEGSLLIIRLAVCKL